MVQDGKIEKAGDREVRIGTGWKYIQNGQRWGKR